MNKKIQFTKEFRIVLMKLLLLLSLILDLTSCSDSDSKKKEIQNRNLILIAGLANTGTLIPNVSCIYKLFLFATTNSNNFNYGCVEVKQNSFYTIESICELQTAIAEKAILSKDSCLSIGFTNAMKLDTSSTFGIDHLCSALQNSSSSFPLPCSTKILTYFTAKGF
ncbi:MAG: hypothetical protein SFU98_10905 [Leptospiraceae bacterium]|nr:hypothetical protein [Leptospiraceae bacterium]